MIDPERKMSQSENAYQEIRNLIISLELKAGMQVNKEELESELSIGRAPVREALLRLTPKAC
jgi:DNA-binding GntR family transcriptional regulator